ncbi:MAG: AAA family ATPase, partial [Candidatus Diapherotrites archaeon]|nr:AAA family ATPase [Candidatus Diapherotrites archaeon]
MIRQLALMNWRSHGEKNGSYGTVIEFEEGLNVIYGVNGSGKSSVAEAIAYALFGEASFSKVLRSGKKEGKVRLLFEADGLYEVIRTFSLRGTLDAELFRLEGNRKRPLVLQKSREVTRKVEEILGISKELFFRGVYGAQNRILELFEKRGLARAEIFDEILGLRELNDVRKFLVKIRNAVERELSLREPGRLLREKKELANELDALREEYLLKLKGLENQRALLDERRSLLEEKRKELEALQPAVTEAEELEKTAQSLRSSAETLKSQIKYPDVEPGHVAELPHLEESLGHAELLDRRAQLLRGEIRSLREQLQSIELPEGVDVEGIREKL